MGERNYEYLKISNGILSDIVSKCLLKTLEKTLYFLKMDN